MSKEILNLDKEDVTLDMLLEQLDASCVSTLAEFFGIRFHPLLYDSFSYFTSF